MDSKKKILIAAPFTPMCEDGSVNLGLIPTYARFLRHNGIDGAFICGTTGEGPSLSLEEKKNVFAAWGSADIEGLQIIAMVGGISLPETQELAEYASNCGLDAISVIAPHYFPLNRIDDLVSFCALVGEAAPEIPMYYYHIPGLSRAYFPMYEFLAKAEVRVPGLIGIKYTHSDLMDFMLCVNRPGKTYHMLWGRDEELVAGLAMGAHGAVGSTYNYLAPVFRKLLQAFENMNLDAARNFQLQANEVIRVLLKYGGIAPGKSFMKMMGLDCGKFRLPIASMDKETEQTIRRELDEVGFFRICSQMLQS